MSRVVKYVILIVVAVPVAVIVAAFLRLGTIWTAYNYKLGWIEVPVRYRLTFGVEVGGVAYTGSTVVQVTYQQIPHCQTNPEPGIAALYKRHAGLLKLPDANILCLIPPP